MSFSMQVINDEEVKAAIEEEIKPVPEEISKLKEVADSNVAMIMSLNSESLENERKFYNLLNHLVYTL